MKNNTSSEEDDSESQVPPSRLFLHGMRLAFSTPGLILLASSAGFGALAKDAGMTMFGSVFMMAVLFALPAQVVLLDTMARGGSLIAGAIAVGFTGVRLLPMALTIMPWLKDPRSPDWQRLIAVHYVAITAWLEGIKLLPHLPEHQRVMTFLGIGTGMWVTTLIGSACGFAAAAAVPPMIAATLLFLTPIYFILSLLAAARQAMDHLAIGIGAALGPIFYYHFPGADLVLTGLIGGTLAYFAGRKIEAIGKEDDE